MGPGDGPHRRGIVTAQQRDAENERGLAAARGEFPGWDFRKVFGGWEAVPAGTPVIPGITLDSVLGKLRQREEER